MERKSMYYLAPGVVEVRDEPIPVPGSDQVLVHTLYSAISPGTELLLYRGHFPDSMSLDENIPSISGAVKYPLMYGYSLVGEIVEVGNEVEQGWIGKKVFAFQPHTSHFVSETHALQVVPDGLSLEDAVFLPNMETAVSFVMDGAPMIGERAFIFGQGIVGLLTTALLAKFPLEGLATFDRYDLRRQASLDLGAGQSIDPQNINFFEQFSLVSDNPQLPRADLVYELSGNPDGLNQAIEAADYEGRIIVGSWYGKKMTKVDFGGWFHRGRLKLISSQVSRINSAYSNRWDKTRRFDLAWEMLKQVKPAQLITHTVPIYDAEKAFNLLEKKPGDTLQVVFKY
ncbi:MAG: zinc-binding alcohol dehydrogenase [Anaerolineales bacterium]|nr:zinc-binding alcohol dehydrogenase [Anaerolineales bacterium]